MGMSSSQARLLNLTARMHQIEYKAAKLEAQKLQMANESTRVYEDYLNALDATKIQYKALMRDGSITFRDANMNIMQNGVIPGYSEEKSSKILFLQNSDGKIMVTPAVAEAFHLADSSSVEPDMDKYVKDVTGKDKVSTQVLDSYTPIANRTQREPDFHHDAFTPVENSGSGIDTSALAGYATFTNTHTSVSGATTVTSSLSSLSAGTYVVKDAAGLMKIAELSAMDSTAGVKIILAPSSSDGTIDMSSINNWTGIKDFQGEFDGNGYVIKGLHGTQGLFDSTNGATIKNVGLEDISINGNSAYIGGLIGKATTTSVTNCYTTGSVKNSSNTHLENDQNGTIPNEFNTGTGGLIGYSFVGSGKTVNYDKVYSAANVEGYDGVGGLIGSSGMRWRNTALNLKNAYAIGNVKGNNFVGGLAGIMYNDEDNASDITDVINCYAGGNVTGNSEVGGFFGGYCFWGDNSDKCEIKQCQSTGKVNGSGSNVGAFAGHLYVKFNSASLDENSQSYIDNYAIKFYNCAFAQNTGASNVFGIITDADGETQSATVSETTVSIPARATIEGEGGLVSINLAGKIPSIESDGSGGYMSNILGVLTKANVFDACNNSQENVPAMKSKIAAYLAQFANNDEDNTKLWYLNIAMVNYLQNGSETNKALANALYTDITNPGGPTTTNTAAYMEGEDLDGMVKRGAGAAWNITGQHIKGVVGIPSVSTIAETVYYAMKKSNPELKKTMDDVKTWFNKYSSLTDDDKITLANINNKLVTGGNLSDLYTAILDNTGRVDYTDNWSDTKLWKINVSGTDETIQIKTHPESRWNTSDPDIANAIAMWAVAQRGVIVVEDKQASSTLYLKNMLAEGEAVFTTFEPSKTAELAAMSKEEILAMTDEEYNEMMGIVNTSISTNTSVQEVSDEKELKKAEAKYEADMKRIDAKDKKYDTQLAALEAERNATKQEMDTLKTVANDNVERTFKLFS